MKSSLLAIRGELLLFVIWVIKLVSFRLPLLRDAYLAVIAKLVRRTNLFDPDYYFESNGDIACAGLDPLRHYVAYGDREGRPPMPFFDPIYYKAHAGRKAGRVNTLIHYTWIGRYRNCSPSPWFDVRYYLGHNIDVLISGQDPLNHYLRWGGREGRDPSPQFDSENYLANNPDVAESGLNPLLHYLTRGRYENRSALPNRGEEDAASEEAPHAEMPARDVWAGLRQRADVPDAEIDVVIPVYKGYAETMRCIYSVLAASYEIACEIVVINDASPDARLTEEIRTLANAGLFTLLENPQNCGFVSTVNRGMTLHAGRDVVLLNSDTEVYDGWLDRLHAAAMRVNMTGTVTPLSNNATICSYPRFLHDNPYPLEIDFAALDQMAAEVNAGFEVEAPTAVGFCMYIKRACLNDVGLFDEKTFGKGYGEENDFCQRAIARGWRNIVSADIFVRHWGSASFQGERAKRVEAATRTINKLHPNYQSDVRRFIDADPLLEARRRLDWERMKRTIRDRNVLIVSHNRGGGVERHVQEDINRLLQSGTGVFLLRPQRGSSDRVFISSPIVRRVLNQRPYDWDNLDPLLAMLKELRITEIHIHSLADFRPAAADQFIDISNRLGIALDINVHDYKAICPRITLTDEHGQYCGEPDEAGCNHCLSARGSEFGIKDIGQWREMRGRLLRSAKSVEVPDLDVAERLAKYFPDVQFGIAPHEDDIFATPVGGAGKPAFNGNLRIMVIGAIGKNKGFDVLQACALDAQRRRLPLEFILMGYSMNDDQLIKVGVKVTGRYQEQEAEKTLRELDPHVVWLPSIGPETYSYTLSLAMRCGLPVYAFDIGAIAARLRRAAQTDGIMPLEFAATPRRINAVFEACVERIKEK